jgi:hypothetical protein
MHGSRIHPEKLRPVGQHQRNYVAAAHAQRHQPSRGPSHLLGVLRPGQDDRVARRAHRHPLRVGRRTDLKRLAQRRRVQPARLDGPLDSVRTHYESPG